MCYASSIGESCALHLHKLQKKFCYYRVKHKEMSLTVEGLCLFVIVHNQAVLQRFLQPNSRRPRLAKAFSSSKTSISTTSARRRRMRSLGLFYRRCRLTPKSKGKARLRPVSWRLRPPLSIFPITTLCRGLTWPFARL